MRNEQYPLKTGHLLVVITLSGQRGEKISLSSAGISRPLAFFHETPQSDNDCAYFQKENCIELGGAMMETERTLYLITER